MNDSVDLQVARLFFSERLRLVFVVGALQRHSAVCIDAELFDHLVVYMTADDDLIVRLFQRDVGADEQEVTVLNPCTGHRVPIDVEHTPHAARAEVAREGLNVNKAENRRYLLNAYRVLMTRARQGMVIFVPPGHRRDLTGSRRSMTGRSRL